MLQGRVALGLHCVPSELEVDRAELQGHHRDNFIPSEVVMAHGDLFGHQVQGSHGFRGATSLYISPTHGKMGVTLLITCLLGN